MAKAVAELKCGAVVMHTRGRAGRVADPRVPCRTSLRNVKRELREWSDKAMLAG